MKDLQQIKEEYAYEHKFEGWADLQDYYIYWDNEILEKAIDQVAIRYAQEQKRGLVGMLEECVSVLTWTLENARPDSDWTTFTNSITNAIVESEELITKHRQS